MTNSEYRATQPPTRSAQPSAEPSDNVTPTPRMKPLTTPRPATPSTPTASSPTPTPEPATTPQTHRHPLRLGDPAESEFATPQQRPKRARQPPHHAPPAMVRASSDQPSPVPPATVEPKSRHSKPDVFASFAAEPAKAPAKSERANPANAATAPEPPLSTRRQLAALPSKRPSRGQARPHSTSGACRRRSGSGWLDRKRTSGPVGHRFTPVTDRVHPCDSASDAVSNSLRRRVLVEGMFVLH